MDNLHFHNTILNNEFFNALHALYITRGGGRGKLLIFNFDSLRIKKKPLS